MKYASFKATLLVLAGLVSSSVFGAVITVRDDLTLLKDGEPWFPIFEVYNLVQNGFNCHTQYYDSAVAAGFNGVLLDGDWVCRDGMQNCVTSDIGFQYMCEPGSYLDPWWPDGWCNYARQLVPLLVPYLEARGWNFADGGWPLCPYSWNGVNETPVRNPFCRADNSEALRDRSTDLCVELVGSSSPFMAFGMEELNNWPRDFGDQRWGEDDFYDLQATLLDQRDYILSARPGSMIFLNFSPSTAARVDHTGEGLEGTGEHVGLSGPRARELWALECNILAEAADIVGLDWQWDSPRDQRYNVAFNVLDNTGGVLDTSVRTQGEYAHYLVDLIGQPQNKPTIFISNWPYVGRDTITGAEVGGPVTDAELLSAWVQCFVAGVKGFAVYSWWAWGEFTPNAEQIWPIEVSRHRMMRRVMGRVFKPLNEWGILTARDATDQPAVAASNHLVEQLTKQGHNGDVWTFAVDRSPEGSAWPFTATFSNYGALLGPVEVWRDGAGFQQRWLWPSNGSFSDEFNRLQSHIYRVYTQGFHDNVLLTEDMVVPTGASLIIQPGTVVRFANGAGLYVEGSLTAQGTEAEPIRFEGDGEADCSGLVLYNGAIGLLEHCEISGCTWMQLQSVADVTVRACHIHDMDIGLDITEVQDSTLLCESNLIEDCMLYGIRGSLSSGTFADNTIEDCGRAGIYWMGDHPYTAEAPYFYRNEIASNGTGGTPIAGGYFNSTTAGLRCNVFNYNAPYQILCENGGNDLAFSMDRYSERRSSQGSRVGA